MRKLCLLGLTLSLLACAEDDGVVNMKFDFAENEGWEAGFSGFEVREGEPFATDVRFEGLPAPLTGHSGLYLLGNEGGDYNGIIIYAKTALGGFEPGQTYDVEFSLNIATDIPKDEGCIRFNPGPGYENVYMRTGLTNIEPVRIDVGRQYGLNIAFGNGANAGQDVVVLEDVTASYSCLTEDEDDGLELKSMNQHGRFMATPDANGELWLIVGADGRAGPSYLDFYLVDLELTATPQ